MRPSCSLIFGSELAAMRPKTLERTLLVRPHQPRIARHIGGEDRGKTPFDRLFHCLSLVR
jgi:hypothetical protein